MIYYGNELYHYGVPGQKWGKRNYQYEDGTYTEEGKARRRKGYSLKENRETLKKIVKATVAVGTASAAALYVSKHPEIIASVISKAKSIKLKDIPSKLVNKGKSAAKEAINKSFKGFKDGLKNAPYKVVKVAAEGTAIIVAKDFLDSIIGKETNENLTKAYNAYNNKKGRIGDVPSFDKKKVKNGGD